MSFKKQFQKIKVPHLTAYIVVWQILVLFLSTFEIIQPYSLPYNIRHVLNGEIWRLFTFVVDPNVSLFLFIIFAYFMYFFGQATENAMGSSKFTWYILINYISLVFAGIIFPNVYLFYSIYTSIFIAFAFIHPNYVIHLYAILPIKAKYIGFFSWLYILYNIVIDDRLDAKLQFGIIATSFFIFFGKSLYYKIKYKQRKITNEKVFQMAKTQARHKCSVCNRTNITDPEMQFKYSVTANNETICFCDEHYLNNG